MKPKQLKAIELLAEGFSIRETAQSVGVTERTLSNWLKNENFRKELDVRVKRNVERELLKKVLIKEDYYRKKQEIMNLIDNAIRDLDLSKPYAIEVLVKYLRALDDMHHRSREVLLELYKKYLEGKSKDDDEPNTIKVIIKRTDTNGKGDRT